MSCKPPKFANCLYWSQFPKSNDFQKTSNPNGGLKQNPYTFFLISLLSNSKKFYIQNPILHSQKTSQKANKGLIIEKQGDAEQQRSGRKCTDQNGRSEIGLRQRNPNSATENRFIPFVLHKISSLCQVQRPRNPWIARSVLVFYFLWILSLFFLGYVENPDLFSWNRRRVFFKMWSFGLWCLFLVCGLKIYLFIILWLLLQKS